VIVGDGPAPNVKRGTIVPAYLKPVKERLGIPNTPGPGRGGVLEWG